MLTRCLPLYLSRSILPILALSLLLNTTTRTMAQDYPLREAVAFTPRDGLPNFFDKLERGETVTIAYLGGSITAQNGWRVLSREWFQEQYPDAAVKEVHAAIGGTGSTLGVFRVEQDALAGKPDLLFIEFAVNDRGTSPANIVKGMEGIVRKAWQLDPDTDICFVYTLTDRESRALAEGKLNGSTSTMEAVADHYGIPSVHLGTEVAQMEKEGTLVMKTDAPMTQVSGEELNEAAALPTDEEGRIIFAKDGVHPYPETGHVLYLQALVRAMEAMRPAPEPHPHALPTPMREDNWEKANLFPIPESYLSGPYVNLTAEQDKLAQRFENRMTPLYRLEPGASLNFKFTGTKLMLYDLRGPDGTWLEITLDGETTRKLNMDKYCSYHRLSILPIGDNLENTEHDVTIRVLDEPVDKGEILEGSNKQDFLANPEKYADAYWYVGAILVVGEPTE